MRFKTKIILTYSLLLFAITVGFGAGFRYYNIHQLQLQARQNGQFISVSLLQQVDEQVKTMEFIPIYLLSDQNFLAACHTLATMDRDTEHGQSLILTAKQNMLPAINSFYLQKNYYRINYFNSNGDFLSSNFQVPSLADGSFSITGAKWLHQSEKQAYGTLHLLRFASDPWAKEAGIPVISLIHRIQGKEQMGYIEVQKDYQIFSDIFRQGESEGVKILVLWEDQVIYSSVGMTVELENYYRQANQLDRKKDVAETPQVAYKENPLLQAPEMLIRAASSYSGMQVIMIQNQNIWFESTSYITVMTGLICLAICLLSFCFIFLLANRLTAPLGILRRKIEQTNIENLADSVNMGGSNDEIYRLETAYNALTQRLQEAIVRETKISALQMQAQFDALQAQINPHFMFNILNVLSHRGVLSEDSTICDICDSLAAMLRYSTNTRNRFATIKEEITYVQDYIVLLKSRYQQNLDCSIKVDPNIEQQKIPKIVIQQMVENAINHGYQRVSGCMRIRILGWQKAGYWHVVIRDDGQGFDPIVLAELQEKMRQIDSCPDDFQPKGLEIGGMGIINTYARLRYFYKTHLIFEIRNCKGRGSLIHIGSLMEAD